MTAHQFLGYVAAAFLATTAAQLGITAYLGRRTHRGRHSVADRPLHTVERIVGERTERFHPPAAFGWVRRGRAAVTRQNRQAQR